MGTALAGDRLKPLGFEETTTFSGFFPAASCPSLPGTEVPGEAGASCWVEVITEIEKMGIF
jgi:hypothetical protein